MTQKLVSIVSLWALIVAPGLCRAGLLTACCTPNERAVESQATADNCCRRTESRPTQAPAPEPRRCESCVCRYDATVKAPDASGKSGCSFFVPVDCEATPTGILTLGPFALRTSSTAAFPANLPFPRSDIPLLI